MKSYGDLHCSRVDFDLLIKLREFAVRKYGSTRNLSDALNYILRWFFEHYNEEIQPKVETVKANKRTLRVLEFILRNFFEDGKDESWVSWEIVKHFIIIELGIKSKPSLNEYYNYLKHIAMKVKEVKIGRKIVKELKFSRRRIITILKQFGYRVSEYEIDRKSREESKIRITKTYEIETSGDITPKDVIECTRQGCNIYGIQKSNYNYDKKKLNWLKEEFGLDEDDLI